MRACALWGHTRAGTYPHSSNLRARHAGDEDEEVVDQQSEEMASSPLDGAADLMYAFVRV